MVLDVGVMVRVPVVGVIVIGGSRPLRCSSSVLLPAPLGPIRPTHSPSATEKLTPRSAGRAVAVAEVQVADLDRGAHRHPRAHIAA